MSTNIAPFHVIIIIIIIITERHKQHLVQGLQGCTCCSPHAFAGAALPSGDQ